VEDNQTQPSILMWDKQTPRAGCSCCVQQELTTLITHTQLIKWQASLQSRALYAEGSMPGMVVESNCR